MVIFKQNMYRSEIKPLDLITYPFTNLCFQIEERFGLSQSSEYFSYVSGF